MKSIYSQLDEIAKRANGDMEEVAAASMLRLGNRIVQGSPVDTGRFKNNWMSAYGSLDPSTPRADNPSGAGSVTDLSVKVNDVQIGGADFFFTNSLPYAYRLETGWSDQASQGVVAVNALSWEKIVTEEVRKRS